MSKKLIFLSLLSVLFWAVPQPAHASFLDDFLTGAKNLFSPAPAGIPQTFSVDRIIQLAPDGDFNHNGVIDSADFVTFTYTIHNPTSTAYPFATLRTNISRHELNFIHNIKGTASLSDSKDTIEIPNLYIKPNQDMVISFDARVNFFDDSDHSLSTQPEVLTESKKSLFNAAKFSLKAKAFPKGHIPSFVRILKN